MNKCLQLGPAIPNPLFCHYLTRYQLYAVLSKALDTLDMDSKRFNSYSNKGCQNKQYKPLAGDTHRTINLALRKAQTRAFR